MGGPVRIDRRYRLVGALVQLTGRERLHRDTAFDRTHIDAEIAAHAFVFHDLEVTHAVHNLRNRLMGSILTGDMAAAAFDAEVLMDDCLWGEVAAQQG